MSGLPAAVLFDMDGTLTDSEPLWHVAEDEVASEIGATWTMEDKLGCLGGPLSLTAERLVARSGRDLDAVAVGERLVATMARLLIDAPLTWRPGAAAFLAAVRATGVPTALVTSSHGDVIAAVRDRIDAAVGGPAFDVIVGGDDVDFGKPHPEPYLSAASSLGAAPADCLAIEDSPTGVASAVAAGCVVVAVPHIAPIDSVPTIDSLEGWTPTVLWAHARGLTA